MKHINVTEDALLLAIDELMGVRDMLGNKPKNKEAVSIINGSIIDLKEKLRNIRAGESWGRMIDEKDY